MLDKLRVYVDKAVKLTSKLNIVLLLFAAYAIKIIVKSPDLPSSLSLGILASAYCFSRFIATKESLRRPDKVKDDVDKLVEDVKELKAAASRGNIGQATKTKKYF